MSTSLDHIEMLWKEDRDWLVGVVFLPNFDEGDLDEGLDWIGKLFAFSLATGTRMLALVGDPPIPAYELWFSFTGQGQKQRRFLQLIRDDGYADPDEEHCIDAPDRLVDVLELRPISEVFPEDPLEHIILLALMTLKCMGSNPRL